MTNCFYSKEGDDESYLEEKHKKYNSIKDDIEITIQG